MPTNETGAVSWKRAHPTLDGRGITIGILDSGVDLDHPALQRTTTGQRKIVDWVTAVDPLLEGDRTWRPMLTTGTGPTITFGGATYRAPAGTYTINTFAEAITAGSEVAGDVNRDGDTTDVWGVLYDPATHDIWVDVDQDRDFTNEVRMRPYREAFQVGHFGQDKPATKDVIERMPFVVEYREDVDLTPAGRPGEKADFVNIGLVQDAHGSHVAGITAANGMFGGDMDGAAPGAKLVSSRACIWSGGCTAVAMTEGMIDLVVNRRVDVVNMSIGGLPALNDGANARTEL
jgi:subtilisin family serine protease